MKPRQEHRKHRVPQQQRARLTVEAVLDATVLLVRREGLGSTTTNRIAELAGVSIGSLYQYFPDKQAIFLALHQRHVRQVDRLIETTLVTGIGSALAERLTALMAALVDLHAAQPQLHELLQAQLPRAPLGALPTPATLPARLQGPLRAAISAQSAGFHHPAELDRSAFVLAHMADALSHGAALERPPGVSLDAAKAEAQGAVMVYLSRWLEQVSRVPTD